MKFKEFIIESDLWENGQQIKGFYLKMFCGIYFWKQNYSIVAGIATMLRSSLSFVSIFRLLNTHDCVNGPFEQFLGNFFQFHLYLYVIKTYK